MKLGLSTSSVFPLKLEDTFRMARDSGYDGVEVMITSNKDSRDISTLRSLEDKYQLPILSIHAPVLILTHFVWGTDPEVKLIKTAELAKLLGSETVVVHPPFSFQTKYAADFLALAKTIEDTIGVDIAVENMFPWKIRGRQAVAYKPSWNEIVEEATHITLDFSHAALSGINSLNEAKRMGDRLTHIHLCDGFGTKTKRSGEETDKVFDEHLPPGFGNQPVAETLQYLADTGWDGNIVSEINTRKYKTWEEKRKVLADSANFARDIFSSAAKSAA